MLQIHVHVADDALSTDESVLLETMITDHIHKLFGDLVEIEIFPRAEETKVIFPDGTGLLTIDAAAILAANVVAAIDREIETTALPSYQVTTTEHQYHEHDGPPPLPVISRVVMHYREVLERWPWMLAILPTTGEESSNFSLRWINGMTEIKIH